MVFYRMLFINLVLFLSFNSAYGKDLGSQLPNPYIIKYPFKSAVIHYEGKSIYGHNVAAEGTETVFIKGDMLTKEKNIVVTNRDGTKDNVKIVRIFGLEYVYTIDFNKKTGTRIDNSKKYGVAAYDNLAEDEKKAFLGRMKRRGAVSIDLLGLGKKIGTDTILGRKCDVYLLGDGAEKNEKNVSTQGNVNSSYTKTWVWKEAKIPLKVVSTAAGLSSVLTATKIEENVNIPDTVFEVPDDIKITYDKETSQIAKRESMARFELYKTGNPMVIRMEAKKEAVMPEESPNPGGSN